MADLAVKEITELNDIEFTDDALLLGYTDKDGVGKTTFANAKKNIGAEISISQTKVASESGGANEITATTRNGKTTSTNKFTIKNGNGLKSITKSESTDANGLRSNSVTFNSNNTTLIPNVSISVKDGVGVKSHSLVESTDANGLRSNKLTVAYTDGKTDTATVKDGVGIKSHNATSSTDANGLKTNTLAIAYTDGKSNSIAIKDGVGINSATQTTSSSVSSGENVFTVKLTNGSSSTIKVYNGRAGKDFRIKKTYKSISAMNSDFSGKDVDTFEFAMIDTGSVEDVDTGKLYCKGTTAWSYIGDLSGKQGIKGETGNGVKTASTTYQLSTSGTTIPTGTWSSTPLAPTNTQYLWTKTVLTFTDGTTHTFYSVGGKSLAGAQGAKGDTGATGTTPTIKCANGANINVVGTPSVTASTSGTTTTFTFNNLKGATGTTGVWNGKVPTSQPSTLSDGMIWIE